MPALNVLSNLFTTLYNNESRRKKECVVIPASRFASEILLAMQKQRFIGEFEQLTMADLVNLESSYWQRSINVE